ncbi:transposase family protein [Streptomyces vietnamensis]|uniref:transposase family protein n=1 Tax=Streptomyces vietnamensis TaxID=362257 RepID=UPI003CCC1B5D
MLWISAALPGRTHDLTAARTPRSSGSASDKVSRSSPIAPTRAPAPGSPPASNDHPAGSSLPTQRTANRGLAAARAPVERGITRLKTWQIFRRSRISPNRMTVIAKTDRDTFIWESEDFPRHPANTSPGPA